MSVVVKSITKRFAAAGTPAVNDVSFEAPHGQITSLLGPSGSGKSTLLRLIAGLEVADMGSVWIDNTDMTKVKVPEREVGFVFQNYALFPTMKVKDNVAFGLSVRGSSPDKSKMRVMELLKAVQLEEYADRYPSQLSGGQRQRVALARAMAIQPKVLLLDEPFGALDARVRAELREWLLKLHEQTKVTTILVTHDQTEALELSDHVVVLFNGKLAQAGDPHQIYDHPATAEVAGFVGGANVLGGGSFVRPHDVRLSRPTGANTGKVLQVRRIGGMMRVAVAMPDGQVVYAETPRAQIAELGIQPGDPVGIDLRAARVFAAALEGLRSAPAPEAPTKPLPRREDAVLLLELGRRVLLPEFTEKGTKKDSEEDLHQLADLIRILAGAECNDADAVTMTVVENLPALRRLLSEDLKAALEADPAAQSAAEVALCYPGFLAITAHRLAHILWSHGARLTARLIAEDAHAKSGVDLHPAAKIGARFFIDHGTGVVVGETAVIGIGVRLYQGVTLGGPSVTAKEATALHGVKRHPTLEDEVIVYANATIIGDIIIGRGSVVGGNSFVTASVPPGSKLGVAGQETVRSLSKHE